MFAYVFNGNSIAVVFLLFILLLHCISRQKEEAVTNKVTATLDIEFILRRKHALRFHSAAWFLPLAMTNSIVTTLLILGPAERTSATDVLSLIKRKHLDGTH